MNIFGIHVCGDEIAAFFAGWTFLSAVRMWWRSYVTNRWLARQPKLECGPYRSQL